MVEFVGWMLAISLYNFMEFISINKKCSQPIHARKGKLAPIAFKPKRAIDSKTKVQGSLKNYDLPRINTLDCNQLTQYMSCQGIKLSIRLNLSVQKRRKKKIDIQHAGSLIRIQKGAVNTAPSATFQLGSLGVLPYKQLLNIRQSKTIENPQELKYMFRIAQISEESLIFKKNTKKQLHAYYIPQKTYVILYPLKNISLQPAPHRHLINPIGVTQISSQKKKYYILKSYDYQSLKHLIIEFGQINARVARTYIRYLVQSVLHLHHNGITHNRLNLDYLMHDGEGNILIDWLRASKAPITQKQKLKYFYYFPPQNLLSRNYNDSEKNDVWAIGCIALQLLSSLSLERCFLHPYNRSTEGYMSESTNILKKVQQLMAMLELPICEQIDKAPINISVLGVQFVSICLTVCIDRRASVRQLLSHPFLSI